MEKAPQTPRGPKLPDLKSIKHFADEQIAHDIYFKQSVEEGYMTREELIISNFIKRYCDYNEPEDSSYDEDKMDQEMVEELGENPTAEEIVEWHDRHPSPWARLLPEAYKAASEQFGISAEHAEELYKKGRNIRYRVIKREQGLDK